MSQEIQVRPSSMFEMGPAQMVGHVSEIATVLRDVIKKQHLAVSIQGREYVKVDGWAALGSILGFLPREVEVKELPDGSYEAKVELYSLNTGKVVGQGSALCGIDEKRWGGADRYARRSMAITRATGKAYRLGLSWIMSMAGYAPTPYEEMPVDEMMAEPVRQAPPRQQQARAKAAPRVASVYTGTSDQVDAVERILSTRGVPTDRWAVIHDRLMNRPSTDLSQIILEVGRQND